MNQEEVLKLFGESRALLEGHFQLTSGLHSPQYFQCARVLQYPRHAALLCAVLADHFRAGSPDAVIAPAIGGIVVAQEVGRQIGVRTMFAERKDDTMQLRRGFEISRGERIIICEDVVTTGGSVKEIIEIIRNHGGILSGVGAVVDRSGGTASFENFHAVVKLSAVTYAPDQCPLCKQNLPIDKPGSRTNAP